MTKTNSYIVINSKAAQKHLDHIKMEHSNILNAIQNHQMLNEQFTREETANKQVQDTQNFQRETNNQKVSLDQQRIKMDSEKMNIEAETRKLAEINKQKELDLKAQALASSE